MTTTLTGNDYQSINGRPLVDFADGDTTSIEFPDDLVQVKVGKNGNTIFAHNASGRRANVTIRVIRGSADDVFFNNLLSEYNNDPPSFSTMLFEFVKRLGNGQGMVTEDTYLLFGGVFQ